MIFDLKLACILISIVLFLSCCGETNDKTLFLGYEAGMTQEQFDSTTEALLQKGDIEKFYSCDQKRFIYVYNFYIDKESRIYGSIDLLERFEKKHLVSLSLVLHSTNCPTMGFENASCSNIKKLLSKYQDKYGSARIAKEGENITVYQWKNNKKSVSFSITETHDFCVGVIEYSLNEKDFGKHLESKLQKEI